MVEAVLKLDDEASQGQRPTPDPRVTTIWDSIWEGGDDPRDVRCRGGARVAATDNGANRGQFGTIKASIPQDQLAARLRLAALEECRGAWRPVVDELASQQQGGDESVAALAAQFRQHVQPLVLR